MKTSEVHEPEIFYGILGKYESNFTDPMNLVAFANRGLEASNFDDLILLSRQSRESFAERLNISVKTLDRYKKEKRNFDPVMGELILKWMQLFIKGAEVFGSIKAFNRWLEKPSSGLSLIIPETLITNSSGVNLVLDELSRIEYGDLS